MKFSTKKILYYIKGAQATPAQYEEAVGLRASFRNVNHCSDDSSLEECDCVIGVFPKGYKKMKGVKILESKIEEDPDVPTTGGTKPWEESADSESETPTPPTE